MNDLCPDKQGVIPVLFNIFLIADMALFWIFLLPQSSHFSLVFFGYPLLQGLILYRICLSDRMFFRGTVILCIRNSFSDLRSIQNKILQITA